MGKGSGTSSSQEVRSCQAQLGSRVTGHGATPEPDLGPEQEIQGQGGTRSINHGVNWLGGVGHWSIFK